MYDQLGFKGKLLRHNLNILIFIIGHFWAGNTKHTSFCIWPVRLPGAATGLQFTHTRFWIGNFGASHTEHSSCDIWQVGPQRATTGQKFTYTRFSSWANQRQQLRVRTLKAIKSIHRINILIKRISEWCTLGQLHITHNFDKWTVGLTRATTQTQFTYTQNLFFGTPELLIHISWKFLKISTKLHYLLWVLEPLIQRIHCIQTP